MQLLRTLEQDQAAADWLLRLQTQIGEPSWRVASTREPPGDGAVGVTVAIVVGSFISFPAQGRFSGSLPCSLVSLVVYCGDILHKLVGSISFWSS